MRNFYEHVFLQNTSGGCFCDWTSNCTTLVTLLTAYILETIEVTKVSQNLQENTCVIVSFLIKLQAKRLWRRSFPVNFAKFLRAPFFKEHLWWVLLQFNVKFILKFKFLKQHKISNWNGFHKTESFWFQNKP